GSAEPVCGIAGADRRALDAGGPDMSKMLGMLQHRGPDDSGEWHGVTWRLGMVRLAIIDPQRGLQPMSSADGRWCLVLNGEIYNFSRLRSELESRGVCFRTASDTEVLLQLIAERGVPGALAAVEGMFAFAAIDTRTGDLRREPRGRGHTGACPTAWTRNVGPLSDAAPRFSRCWTPACASGWWPMCRSGSS